MRSYQKKDSGCSLSAVKLSGLIAYGALAPVLAAVLGRRFLAQEDQKNTTITDDNAMNDLSVAGIGAGFGLLLGLFNGCFINTDKKIKTMLLVWFLGAATAIIARVIAAAIPVNHRHKITQYEQIKQSAIFSIPGAALAEVAVFSVVIFLLLACFAVKEQCREVKPEEMGLMSLAFRPTTGPG